MRTRRICILGMLLLWVGVECWAQSPSTALFKVQSDKTVSAAIVPVQFETSGEFSLKNTSSVYGLSISGHIVLMHETNSMVRITAECSDGIEYLVYEANPLLVDEQEFDISDVAMETAILQAENVVKLNITLLNATFTLQNVKYALSAPQSKLQARQSIQKAQENAIIDRLNESLEKKGALWRAGNTSISELTYEQKKAIFGDSVPYLGGFEYYRGGIFVMPGYDPQAANKAKSADDDKYVKEWDWRNRHGKNWMTPVKNQGKCGSCWIFSPVAAIESYINLYYNSTLNVDLSEQQMVSCIDPGFGCKGHAPHMVFSFVSKNGITNESCYPYIADTGDCEDVCRNPTDIIKTRGYKTVYSGNNLKEELFRAPVCFGIISWTHEILAIGYKTIEKGDRILIKTGDEDRWLTVPENSEYIGSTAWLIKNSHGTSFGDNGYAYVLTDWSNTYYVYAITGDIESQKLSNNDIVISDEDGDGYYFWGVGERPSGLPDWIPIDADGDDSDQTKGPIDDYGNLIDITNATINNDIHISKTTSWSSLNYCIPNVYVEAGATLTITGKICLNPNSRFFIKKGGTLVLNGANLTRASIKVYSGGRLEIKNNTFLERWSEDVLEIDSGGTMLWQDGKMTIKN